MAHFYTENVHSAWGRMPNDPFSHCPAITNFDNDLMEKIKAELTWLSLGRRRRVISQVGDFMTVLLA